MAAKGRADCVHGICEQLLKWWWLPELFPVSPNQYADFSSDFSLETAPSSAHILLSCSSSLSLWVNQKWIFHGPTREAPPWIYYEKIDLLPFLSEGLNQIRVRAHHIGVSHQSHSCRPPAVCLAGEITTSKTSFDLGLADAWRCRPSPGFVPHANRLNGCLGFSEHFDLNTDPSAWLTLPHDLCGRPPVPVASPVSEPKYLLLNDIHLEETGSFPASFLSKNDAWQTWDFGGEVFGFLSLDASSPFPSRCEILHGESLTPNGLPDHNFGGGDFREILDFPAATRHWESFEKRALRYLALPASLQVHSLRVREYSRPLHPVWRENKNFSSLDERDRAIVSAAERTVAICTDDLLNDCPRRERAQYSDPAIYMEAFPRLFGTWEPIRKWFLQYLRGADDNGVLSACYPSSNENRLVIPDFSISFASHLSRYLEATGDSDTARACFPSALAGIRSFEKYAAPDGLLSDVPGWVFLCNTFELSKKPASSALNALWAESWNHLASLAFQLEIPSHQAFKKKSELLRAAWRKRFFSNGKLLDSSGANPAAHLSWWNYHYDADAGGFLPPSSPSSAFALSLRWEGTAKTIFLAAPGKTRLWLDGKLLLDASPSNPWLTPLPYEPWSCPLPENFSGGHFVIEAAYNPIDWEIYFAADAGAPTECSVGTTANFSSSDFHQLNQAAKRPAAPRPWRIPKANQITAGYAVSCGMLEPEEARPLLELCLRDTYFVPWKKRTTPLPCVPTDNETLIAERSLLCNTPHSLSFFCKALAMNGMKPVAAELCRKLFGAMIDAGSDTLWEEFAPRSSLCHAWGAMCVEYLLPEPVSSQD